MLRTLAPARFATPHDLLSKSRTVTVSKSSAGEWRLEQTSFVSAAQIWRGKIKRHIEGCVPQGHKLNNDIEKTAQLTGYKLGRQNLDY